MKRSVISAHPTVMAVCNRLSCALWAFTPIHAASSDPVEPIVNVTRQRDLNQSLLFKHSDQHDKRFLSSQTNERQRR